MEQYYFEGNLHQMMLRTTYDASDGRNKAHWREKKRGDTFEA